MFIKPIKISVAVLAAGACGAWVFSYGPALAQPSLITRQVLLQRDAAIAGYEGIMIAQEIAPGGREGKHTHPGMLYAYIREGALTVEVAGRAPVTYKAGETFYLEPGVVHEGMNTGTVPMKALATFVTPKGKPLMAPSK